MKTYDDTKYNTLRNELIPIIMDTSNKLSLAQAIGSADEIRELEDKLDSLLMARMDMQDGNFAAAYQLLEQNKI